MAVIAFVPARCGSKSIPLKNIKIFYGKPLIYWVLNALESSAQVDQVVVATDCDEIESCVTQFNFTRVRIYRRDKENASDQSSTESVMLEYLNKNTHNKEDMFMLCQATSPLTTAEDIDGALKQFKKENADSLLTCCRLKRFMWTEQGIPVNYDYTSRPRRQDFKGALIENGALYISSVGAVLKSKNRLSGKISIYEMSPDTFTELDESEDWLIAESGMRKRLGKAINKTIKLVLSDVDGVLTDAGMYYTENGDEIKKFNTYDGMAFKLFMAKGIKTGLLTSENRLLNKRRAEKLKMDFIFQGAEDKLSIAMELCKKEGIGLDEVAYIGDDINDLSLLEKVGLPACPANAQQTIRQIPNILLLSKRGGEGVVRELYDLIFP